MHWLAGWLAGRLASWLADWQAGRLAGWLAGLYRYLPTATERESM